MKRAPTSLSIGFSVLVLSGAVLAGEARLPPKNCVEDIAQKKEMAEMYRMIMADLDRMEPNLNAGPESLRQIRQQCANLFNDAERCNLLGVTAGN